MTTISLKEDIKKIRKILKEVERIEETDGCYNSYNKTHPFICKVIHDVRYLLEDRLYVHFDSPEVVRKK
jgi:hypothetical protein